MTSGPHTHGTQVEDQMMCISSKSELERPRKEYREEIVVFFLGKGGLGEIIGLSRPSRPGPHHRWPRGVTRMLAPCSRKKAESSVGACLPTRREQ